ncbi:MAG: TVP38/TMEM64 family protein [Deltaproteobacteria bacterium]|nr:TVP38/TMEM64 family protein [Deltaproteobacteria bacterium]MBW2393745.1 TVP38/TMEM64 family protein [Deltaproteobacteria bacterium]
MNPRLLALPAFALFLFAFWWSGALGVLTDAERMQALLADSGVLGPLLYVAVFALIEPLGVPGIFFIGPATTVWPYWTVVGLSLAGAVGAGIVSYIAARWFLRDWVQEHLPPRVRRFTRHAEERPLRTVILVRLVFFLAAPAHWALGISNIRFVPFVLGSMIGFAPPMMALVFGTEALVAYLQENGLDWRAGVVAAGVAVVLLLGYLWRRGDGHATPTDPLP